MLLITCPYCGPRSELEFAYGGQAHIARPADPSSLDDDAWAAFLYLRTNPKGLHTERWRHAHGCGRFFNAMRDTTNDVILHTYEVGRQPPKLDALKREAVR